MTNPETRLVISMLTQNLENNALLVKYANDLLTRNGPDPSEYLKVMQLVDTITPDQVNEFRDLMKPILHPGTIIGFSFTKPFGYNGDFFIIEKMYQRYVNPDEKCRKWDEFFHELPAAIAVVNRKQLAIEQFKKLNREAAGQRKHVLILGSGPVNEANEYLTQTPDNHLTFDMIDLDQRAIDYAKNKNRDHLHLLNFMNKNVIRFTPDKQYDLIWSAGLFDYFKDKHFVFLIKKFYAYIRTGGEMIIGNFNIENPSKKIMEILGDWFLYHRSIAELEEFAVRAGVPKRCIEVLQEPLGINLFLKVSK
jgi:extracellular factor (EF) 3-hydroxypalmitic acid methyl ester biosynthesis protein